MLATQLITKKVVVNNAACHIDAIVVTITTLFLRMTLVCWQSNDVLYHDGLAEDYGMSNGITTILQSYRNSSYCLYFFIEWLCILTLSHQKHGYFPYGYNVYCAPIRKILWFYLLLFRCFFINLLAAGGGGSNLKSVISEQSYVSNSWTLLVKLLSGECHRKPLMVGQQWFR